ncbi:MAG: peptidylprolyl isomerase [Anaerolineae bacterium UTCFX2]|jgi:FKBP-type peptidyl-prolyl cis-trans isomerase FkpA|nr:MAG: peptidylprolyl isomerase [Anaerolineae bacterium UTCFX2]
MRNTRIAIGAVVVIILAAVAFFVYNSRPPAESQPTPGGTMITTASGLQYEDLVIGTGAQAQPGDTVSVQYTGWLQDGTKFDSSLNRNQPFTFTLDMGNVIRGWDEGVGGMKVGGKRRLVIPPDLAYGSRGAGGVIPPNATLIFEVELLEVR